MTCSEFEQHISGSGAGEPQEAGRGAAADAHRACCAECTALWEADQSLQQQLAQAAQALAVRQPPTKIKHQLDAALREAAQRRQPSRRLPAWSAWAAGMAAAVALAVLWPRPAAPPVSAPPQTAATGVIEFLPLTPDGLPPSGGRLVRVYLPNTAPGYWGLPIAEAGSVLPAEVILGDDGVAHAVRFVSAEEAAAGWR